MHFGPRLLLSRVHTSTEAQQSLYENTFTFTHQIFKLNKLITISPLNMLPLNFVIVKIHELFSHTLSHRAGSKSTYWCVLCSSIVFLIYTVSCIYCAKSRVTVDVNVCSGGVCTVVERFRLFNEQTQMHGCLAPLGTWVKAPSFVVVNFLHINCLTTYLQYITFINKTSSEATGCSLPWCDGFSDVGCFLFTTPERGWGFLYLLLSHLRAAGHWPHMSTSTQWIPAKPSSAVRIFGTRNLAILWHRIRNSGPVLLPWETLLSCLSVAFLKTVPRSNVNQAFILFSDFWKSNS